MKKNKKMLFLLTVLLMLLGIVFFKVLDKVRYGQIAKEPINSISCQVTEELLPGNPIRKEAFLVRAVTISGLSYEVKEYELDKNEVPLHGSEFQVIVQYKHLSQTITAPIKRKPVVEYSIGYPNPEDVKATIYANGDLHFTGNGNTLNFRQGNMPWAKEAYSYVIFEENVAPINMDYWFQGNKELEICENLPVSLESMRYTFSECSSLLSTPDYFPCIHLRTMEGAFKNCLSLTKAEMLPRNLINASQTFFGCEALSHGADMSKVSSLTEIGKIYYGCTSLIQIPKLPDSIKNMESAFAECVNIREATVFPNGVTTITASYQNCTSLEKGAAIPTGVLYANSCYMGCSDLNGELEIHTDTEHIYRILEKAATTERTLVLSGESGRLIKIQQDTNNPDIVLKDPEAALRNQYRMETELEKQR